MAPELFRGGVHENITVRIFDHERPVHVDVKLEVRGQTIASNSTEIHKLGQIQIKTPEDLNGKARLSVCGNCHLQSGYIFSNETVISLTPRGTIAFIQTGKATIKILSLSTIFTFRQAPLQTWSKYSDQCFHTRSGNAAGQRPRQVVSSRSPGIAHHPVEC